MFLAGMKMHEKFDRLVVRFSSEGINQIVFFPLPAVFYAWTARPLMTCEPRAVRLLHRHGAVPLKQHFQTGHIRTRSLRRPQYLNNIVEQDHRAVKRVTKPMLNFKSFRAAKCVLAGIELMHMIRKGQLMMEGCNARSFADQFYALAGQIRPV